MTMLALTNEGCSSVSSCRFLLFFLVFVRSVVVFAARISIVFEQASFIFIFDVGVSSLCTSGDFSSYRKAALNQYGTFPVVAVPSPSLPMQRPARRPPRQHTSKRGKESPSLPVVSPHVQYF